jgi:hypothetical protein
LCKIFHILRGTFGSATISQELFDSLESPMLKEKDLRSFKKKGQKVTKVRDP